VRPSLLPSAISPSVTRPLGLLAATTVATALLASHAAPAEAAPEATAQVVTGQVVDAVGRWTSDGSRIVTDATIRTADGRDVVVSQLGGHADGYGMITFPGPALLETGMRVSVTAHAAQAFTGARSRSVLVVDGVQVDGSSRERAFVRNGPTKGGHFLSWASGCVLMIYASEGTSHLAGDLEFTVLDDTLKTWTNVPGSYIELRSAGRETREVGKDIVNVVKFRDTRWCRPAVDGDPERCHSADAAAITTLAFIDDAGSDRDGEIVDADVEVNGVNFDISTDGKSEHSSGGCFADLGNTMTHELGHVLGLDHTCILSGQAASIDNDGNPVPRCDLTTDEDIREATMFAAQVCSETKKITLGNNDLEAVETIYPVAQDPRECAPPDDLSSGCCSASGDARGSLLLGAGTMLMLFARRRRRA
jgi:hypothetical protein